MQNFMSRENWAPPTGRVDPNRAFETVKVRALRPFFWRDTRWTRGVALPMGETRRVEPGDVIEAISPEAASLVAIGRAEYV